MTGLTPPMPNFTVMRSGTVPANTAAIHVEYADSITVPFPVMAVATACQVAVAAGSFSSTGFAPRTVVVPPEGKAVPRFVKIKGNEAAVVACRQSSTLVTRMIFVEEPPSHANTDDADGVGILPVPFKDPRYVGIFPNVST